MDDPGFNSAHKLRTEGLRTNEDYLQELTYLRRELINWVYYLQHRVMTEGNFDAMVYLEEQGHPDLIMASYHDWLQYHMAQERRFNNWYPAANRAGYWPPATPERVSDPSTTLPSDDIANGGGGIKYGANPSGQGGIPRWEKTNTIIN